MKIGYYASFEIDGRDSGIDGIVLDHNEQWVLVNRWRGDWFDGYTVFRKKYISAEYKDEIAENKIKTALYYDAPDYSKVRTMELTTVEQILGFIGEHYSLLQLEVISGKELKNVRFTGKEGEFFNFKELTSKLRWRYTFVVPDRELNFINFGNNELLHITKELYN